MFRLEMVEPFIEVLRNPAEVDPRLSLRLNEIVCRLQNVLGAIFANRFRGNFALALYSARMSALILGLVFMRLLKQF